MNSRQFAKLSEEEARKRAAEAFNDVDGRLAGADAQSLMDDVRLHGRSMSLGADAPALSGRPLLIATATRDDTSDQADELRAALAKIPAGHVTYRLFDTDHGFNDQRIALETFVLDWLGTLPVAPAC